MALLHALAAAGVKGDSVVTLKTNAGSFVIKANSLTNGQPFLSGILQQDTKSSPASTTSSSSPASLNEIQPPKMSPKRKGRPSAKMKEENTHGAVGGIARGRPPKNQAAFTMNKNAAGGRGASNYRKMETKSDFVSQVESKVRCLYTECDKPEVLLKREVERLNNLRNNKRSLFTIQKHALSRIARKGGLWEASGFLYTTKSSHTWPTETVPRPNFEHAWRYRLVKANHFATVGHLLRILHCCMKWELINNKPPKGVHRTVTTNKGVIQVEILDGYPLNAAGREYKYKVHYLP